jgi:hypothetical protein
MIKFLTLGLLFMILYRLIFSRPKSIENPDPSNHRMTEEDTIDVDYEDVE